jgi:hypothetical protein
VLERLRRQERDEQINEIIDRAAQLRERWNNRLTLDNRRFIKRYFDAESWIAVVYTIKVASGFRAEQYCAIFQAAVSRPQSKGGADYGLLLPRDIHLHAKKHSLVASKDGEQQAMLVDYVELMEAPQTVVPSTVWFQRGDDISGWPGNALAYSLKDGFKFVAISPYREDIIVGDGLSVDLDKLTPQEIERGAEVMNCVSCDGGKMIRRTCSELDAILQVARLGIGLADDLIRVRLVERRDLGTKLVDVLIGPFNLETRATTSIRHQERVPCRSRFAKLS